MHFFQSFSVKVPTLFLCYTEVPFQNRSLLKSVFTESFGILKLSVSALFPIPLTDDYIELL